MSQVPSSICVVNVNINGEQITELILYTLLSYLSKNE